MRTALAVLGVLVVTTLLIAQDRQPRVIDLGHVIRATDPAWDAAPAFQRSVVATMEKDGYAAGKITVEEHFGTHVDAPAHFAPGGWTVDRIPIDRLYRSGVRVDVSKQAGANPDYRVTAADLQAFEERRFDRCRLVVETSLQLSAWEVDQPDDPTLHHQLTGRALGALSQAI